MKILTPKETFDQLGSRSPVDIECLNCNKTFQRNKHRVQDYIKKGNHSGAFCCQDCAGQYKTKINTINTTCKLCNSPIIRQKSDTNNSGNHFCNNSCSAKYYNQFKQTKFTKLTCPQCNTIFERKTYDIHIENKRHFCSRKCLHESLIKYENTTLLSTEIKERIPIHKPSITVNCINCNKETLKSPYQIKHNKYHFCSRSCQAIYGNKTFNRSTRFGVNKSRAESRLVEIIKKDFPNLNIIENDRKILNGLELDLYIPDKNIGIELNGPCHYIPIFGEKELRKTKNKDIIKKETMQKLKIHFFQINIMGAGKKLPEILNNAYNEYIKPLLL